MSTKIVTSIYANLYGTDLGGRSSRGEHYKYSLLALMNMSEADFVCYTSQEEYNDLLNFFHQQQHISKDKLKLKTFDLRNFSLTNKINKIKNIEDTKKSDRCVEIQYCKFIWSLMESDENYNNLFWFDAGLSHAGLFPRRYMIQNGYWSQNFSCTLFNNVFLQKLINFTEDKITIIAKENQMNYWSGTVPSKYYNQYCMDRHIIGGFFGGKKEKMIEYCNLFLEYANKLLDNENLLYYEENIMTLMFYNHPELFKTKYFDIWWHEDDYMPGMDLKEYTQTRKSFYKAIEEIYDDNIN